MLRGLLRAQMRRASSITGVDQARLRLLEDLRPKLAASGWEAEEVSVADRAAASAEKVLRLQDSELRSIAVQLAMQGNKRCAHSALLSRIGSEAEAVATAVFEQQYSRLMTELAQRSTDFWGAKQAVPAAQCVSPLAARLLSAARVDELLNTGVCLVDGALGPAEVLAARRELERVHGAGELRDAQQRGVRNDLVGWLDSSRLAATPALAPVVSLLRGLPAEVERHAGSSGGPQWRLAVPAMVQVTGPQPPP